MKGFKPFPLLGLAIIFGMLLMTACGGKIPANGPRALNFVTTSPLPTGAEGDPYSQTIQATGGVQPYTWSLTSGTLPPGFTFSAAGVLSGTPPPGSGGTGTTGMTYTFSVKVTDSQSPTQAYNTTTFSITINPPLTFTSSTLANGVIGAAYSATVTACGTQNGTQVSCGIPPYTYSVVQDPNCLFTTTLNCASNGGLTMNSSGNITGTPTGPTGTFTFTVQVTDGFPTTATANFSITITAKIQGTYAFSFNGYNNGQPFYMAGSFCADGAGNINPANSPSCPNGVVFVLDRNGKDAVGTVTNAPFTGTYTVSNTTSLGTMTLTIPGAGTFNYNLAASSVAESRFIETDANSYGSGVIRPTTAISLPSSTSNCGGYSFGFSGNDAAGGRLAGAGSFVPGASGSLTGVEDTNDNGTTAAMTSFTGTMTLPPSGSPRGTITFTVGSNTIDYAFYVVVSAAGAVPRLLAVQTDPAKSGASLTLATLIKQSSAGATCTFGNTALNGVAVTELNATSNGGTTPDISLGLANFDGAGNITSYMFDENNAGVLTTPSQNSYTGTYSVDPKTARVTVTGLGSYQPVWYLTSANMGSNSVFVVGTDPNVTAGVFEPQGASVHTGGGFFVVDLFGAFVGGTSNPVLADVTNEVESTTAAPPPPPGTGAGTYVSTYDANGSGGVQTNQPFNGAFCLADNTENVCPSTQLPQNSTGRMLILDTTNNNATVDILYLVNVGTKPNYTDAKHVLLSTDTNPSLTPVTR